MNVVMVGFIWRHCRDFVCLRGYEVMKRINFVKISRYINFLTIIFWNILPLTFKMGGV